VSIIRNFTVRAALLLACSTGALESASLLEQRIEHTLRTSRAVMPGSVGIGVVQVATGRTLYSLNAEKLFIPASNTKLFSTALALTRLGPDYQFVTRVFAAAAPDGKGQVDGDLVLVGTGDPSMSFLRVPYDRDAEPADPMEAIEGFADQVAAKGVRTIRGDIVGDDRAYVWEPFAPGWGIHDPIWQYGAPVSALNLGNNSVRVWLEPSAVDGEPAAMQIMPGFEYLTIENRTWSGAGAEDDLEVRQTGPRQVQISGLVVRKERRDALYLAVDDPALYAAAALYDALARRGIRVEGRPVARHRTSEAAVEVAGGVLMAERRSPPMSELVRVIDKVSQNLWAELVLREVARVQRGVGARRAALEELTAFLKEIGIAEEDHAFTDGSGLSRMGLVKPDAVLALLRYMFASQYRELWVSALPVAGEDGTLERRFGKDPAAKAIQAKTGSLSRVNALSGYADSATYGELAFSIMVNNTNASAREVREFIDRIGMILLE
jgi:serine-type D-Ala-D-Ala carboxypeptidase/endopeptidase (penicillin-binding protein 4)